MKRISQLPCNSQDNAQTVDGNGINWSSPSRLILSVLIIVFFQLLAQSSWAEIEQSSSVSTNNAKAVYSLTEAELHQFTHDLLGVGKGKRGDQFSNQFMRWEMPVGYYLKGLEEYPDIENKVVNQINEVVELTGLTVERHQQVLFKTPNNVKKSPSDQVFTNVYIYFMESVEEAFTNKDVKMVLRAMGKDLNSEFLSLVIDRSNLKSKEINSYYYNYDENGFNFVLILVDRHDILASQPSLIDYIASLHVSSALIQLYASSDTHIYSRYTPKPKNRNVFNITPLDKDFIRAYYSDKITSNIPREEAARAIARELFHTYGKHH